MTAHANPRPTAGSLAGRVDVGPGHLVVTTPSSWLHLDLADDRPGVAARFISDLGEPDGGPAGEKLGAEVTAALDASIRAAKQHGAAMAAIWARPVHGRLVGASMTAAVAPLGTAAERLHEGTVDVPALLATMAAGLRRRSGRPVATSVVATGAGPALRVTSTVVVPAMGGEHEARVVQHLLPVPQHLCMVVLTFSTPTVALADALDRIFDGIAARVRWQSAAGRDDQALG